MKGVAVLANSPAPKRTEDVLPMRHSLEVGDEEARMILTAMVDL
jgi:hypothetical protein